MQQKLHKANAGLPSTTFIASPQKPRSGNGGHTTSKNHRRLINKSGANSSVGSPSTTFIASPQKSRSENGGHTTSKNHRRLINKSGAGFTMIELIVVIAIIAVLSAIVMASFSSTQAKSRDARRMNDLRQVENALNLYFTNRGNFPIEEAEVSITGTDDFSTTLITEGSIKAVPTDPASPGFSYSYQSNAEGSTYTLTFCLETNDIERFSEGCGNTLTP